MGGYWIPDAVLAKAKSTAEIYRPARDYDYGWWFNYFWKEARANPDRDDALRWALSEVLEGPLQVHLPPQMTREDQKAYGDTIFPAAGANSDFRRAWPPQAPPADAALAAQPDAYRAQLVHLMNIGFAPMPLKRLDALPLEQAAQMFRNIVGVSDGGQGRRPVAIAYRGETRSFETVKEQGTTPRALLGALAGMNIEQRWHPYSDDKVRSQWYARRGSGDNCLYTVNSVADAPSLSVGFPLIEDPNIYTIPDYHTTAVLPVKAPRLALCRIAAVPHKPFGIFLATESHLYAMRLDEGANTQAFVEGEFRINQGQCVERATGEIAFGRYLAGVRVRRIHKGPIRMSGIAADVLERRYQAGGRWFTEREVGSVPDFLAEGHFAKDTVAALEAAEILRTAFGEPGTSHVIDGEWETQYNPEGKVQVVQFERYISDLGDFKRLKADPEVFLPPPLAAPVAAAARAAPQARGLATCPKCGKKMPHGMLAMHEC